MGFEKFEKGSFRGQGAPQVTLRKSGSIGISKAAVDEYLPDSDGAVLYYDDEANRIGIEPVAVEDDPDAYQISFNEGSATINGTSFLKRFGLVPDETTAHEPEWDDDKGMIVVDLDSAD
jgi:hypothetical protein